MHLLSIPFQHLRTSLIIVCAVAFFLSGTACKRTAENNANGNANAGTTASADETSSTPPFQTKEPERYQATMVTSGSLGGQAANIPGLSSPTTKELQMARDGDKRRVESELLMGIKVTFLQLPEGRYLLYPAKKLYAEIKLDGTDSAFNPAQGVPSDFGPDKLVKGAPAGAKYEKLGTENVNGRTTTKYRVTSGSAQGEQAAPSTESLIWVDESLGMPIKMESTSANGTKYSMELRDIKLEVDAKLFELPKDYREVEQREIVNQAVPTLQDLLGKGKEEKKAKKP